MLKWGVRVLLALALGAALQTATAALACVAVVGLLLTACSPRQLPKATAVAVLATGTHLLAGPVAHAGPLPSLTILSHSSSAQSNVPVTFGQTFKPGDVPSGTTVSAATASGTPVTLQLDAKATHPDGSLRHAVITAVVPTLAANGSQVVQLSNTGTGSSGTAVRLSDLLATSFDAQVSLNIGGTTYTASARQLLQNTASPVVWLSGPQASEWIVGGSVKTSGGVAHPHLAAYFHVRAFAGNPINRVRVDVVIENGWTFVSGPTTFGYTASVTVGGNSVYSGTISQPHHTRWHKRYWWGTDPQTYVQHDTIYLQSTGAVPRYMSLTPSQTYLSAMTQESVPMSNGDLTQYFPTTGSQNSIGPLPRWTTAYVLSADERAFKNMLANDDSAGSYSVHFRDENTGKPVSIADHPNLTDQFSQADGGGLPDPSGTNPNTADAAHQPSISFVSYLETGDYFYLEELQFWTSWNHLDANPLPPYGYRQGASGIFGVQVRGQAWSIRNLAQAAYATPDGDRYKAELVSSVAANLSNAGSLYANNASANKLGVIASYDGYQLFAPWMDHFYTWTMGYLVDLGFNANAMRAWKAQFPVGIMQTSGYCYLHATAYHLITGTSNTVWWPDFATLYLQNFGVLTACAPGGTMDGYPDQPDGYPANLRPALAVAVDSGITGASAAWDLFMTSTPQPNFADYANWAVVPRQSAGGSGVSLTLSASPNPVVSGQSVTLTWVTAGATACTASGAWTGSKAASGSATVGPLTTGTTYTLNCTGSAGSIQRSITVNIASSTPAPTVTISANPTSVAANGVSGLTWSSTNATTCTASGGWSGMQATSGTKQVGPLTASTTYTLSCTGSGGTTQQAATVTVSGGGGTSPPPGTSVPTVTLSAASTSISAGGSTTLTWSSTNATSCAGSGTWSGPLAVSGSQSTGALNTTSTYTLACTGSGGSASQSVTVAVASAAMGSGSGSGPGTSTSASSGGGGALGLPSILFLLLVWGVRVLMTDDRMLAVRR